jgi:hypothetical protein
MHIRYICSDIDQAVALNFGRISSALKLFGMVIQYPVGALKAASMVYLGMIS